MCKSECFVLQVTETHLEPASKGGRTARILAQLTRAEAASQKSGSPRAGAGPGAAGDASLPPAHHALSTLCCHPSRGLAPCLIHSDPVWQRSGPLAAVVSGYDSSVAKEEKLSPWLQENKTVKDSNCQCGPPVWLGGEVL